MSLQITSYNGCSCVVRWCVVFAVELCRANNYAVDQHAAVIANEAVSCCSSPHRLSGHWSNSETDGGCCSCRRRTIRATGRRSAVRTHTAATVCCRGGGRQRAVRLAALLSPSSAGPRRDVDAPARASSRSVLAGADRTAVTKSIAPAPATATATVTACYRSAATCSHRRRLRFTSVPAVTSSSPSSAGGRSGSRGGGVWVLLAVAGNTQSAVTSTAAPGRRRNARQTARTSTNSARRRSISSGCGSSSAGRSRRQSSLQETVELAATDTDQRQSYDTDH